MKGDSSLNWWTHIRTHAKQATTIPKGRNSLRIKCFVETYKLPKWFVKKLHIQIIEIHGWKTKFWIGSTVGSCFTLRGRWFQSQRVKPALAELRFRKASILHLGVLRRYWSSGRRGHGTTCLITMLRDIQCLAIGFVLLHMLSCNNPDKMLRCINNLFCCWFIEIISCLSNWIQIKIGISTQFSKMRIKTAHIIEYHTHVSRWIVICRSPASPTENFLPRSSRVAVIRSQVFS